MARTAGRLKPKQYLSAPLPPEPDGQDGGEAQIPRAVGSGGGQHDDESQGAVAPQSPGRARTDLRPGLLVPDLAALHRIMGLYARELEGIERQRVGMRLRIAALERDGLGAMVGTEEMP